MKPVLGIASIALAAGIGFGLRGLVRPGDASTSAGARVGTAADSQTGTDPADAARLLAELEQARMQVSNLESSVIRLRSDLSAAEEGRIAREREFLRFTQGIAQLTSLAANGAPQFEPDVPADRPRILDVPKSDAESELALAAAAHRAPDAITAGDRGAAVHGGVPGPSAAAPALLAPLPAPPDVERSRAIFLTLRALLAAEQVTSLDLLESGNLSGRSVGPVVLRVLDDRGRPLGSIAAERLRLEGSRAARMITIVLEVGYERRGGAKMAFEGGPADADGRGGVRRIALPDCDPRPWFDGLPELFEADELVRSIDDGRHDLAALRATLNQLLHEDAASGWYRVQGIGGVQGSVLRDVALDRLDRDGKLERRFFADRLSIQREAQGLQLVLEGGSQVRGDQKTPFLDGRCRIFLPRAAADAWIAARVPGLAPDDPPPLQPAREGQSKKP